MSKEKIIKKECENCMGDGYIVFTTKGSAITEDLFGIKEDVEDCSYCDGLGYHETVISKK